MLLKKMTLVQAHIRGKRTNRGGWDSSSPAACIRILTAEFTGGGASRRWSLAEKERLLRRCRMLEPGAIALHTYQMIKILRAALEPFLETSREIFVHHQFSNLPAK
jgi:hypothetical protein